MTDNPGLQAILTSGGGLFGSRAAGGVLLGSEASGLAADFTATYPNLVIRDAVGSTNYAGDPFNANGGKITFTRASGATRVNSLGLIETVGNDVPRIDYDPVTLAAKGLLVEEQRSNLVLWSNDPSNATWTKTNLNDVTNKTTGPDAVANTGTLLNENTVNSEHGVSQNFTKAATATTYTLSCFAKVGVGRTRITLAGYSNTESGTGTFAPFDLSSGQTGTLSVRGSGWSGSTSSIASFGNGWYRCTLTVTTSTGTDITFQILNDSGSGTATQARSYAGTIGNGCYIYGAQLEAGSFATSYIPTTSASTTRSADVAQVGTAAFPYSATEGTLVISADTVRTSGYGSIVSARLDTNNNINIGVVGASGYENIKIAGAETALWNDANAINVNKYANGAIAKAGIAYKANDSAAAVNGTAGTTNTTSAITAWDTLQIGNDPINRYLNGHIRQITYVPRRLSNAELQTRTA